MDKIKILVACHKPGPVYQDEVYTPIHVGRAISKCKEEMADMIGDDTGENISEKNPYYAELTAQYWAWKNIQDVEYIGFCHYRRYFDIKISNDNVDNFFKKHDVILINDILKYPVVTETYRWILQDDISIFMMVLKRKYPEYEKTTLDYLWSIDWHGRNMLVCRKKDFDLYAEWLFGIIEECERYVKPSGYTNRRRVYGYLGELFMPVFFLHNGYRIKNVRESPNRPQKRHIKVRKRIKFLMRRWHHYCMSMTPFYEKPDSFDDFYDPNVLNGFKMDQIHPEI
jgi:hypothetical protein